MCSTLVKSIKVGDEVGLDEGKLSWLKTIWINWSKPCAVSWFTIAPLGFAVIVHGVILLILNTISALKVKQNSSKQNCVN